jgi:recombination protein RecT
MSTATAKKTANTGNVLALIKKDVVDVVGKKVQEFVSRGELHLPPNYSVENAMKSAWLVLQEVTDKDGKLALEVCTRDSVANALLKMVVQGLNPAKNQCYFVVFGKSLVMMRSYFGSIHVAKSVNPEIEDIIPDVVYEGDEFEYEKKRGKTHIISHKQKLENIKKDKIIAAYATVLYKDGGDESIVMTMDEIKEAWTMSKVKPIDEKGNIRTGTTHEKFTAEMCKKTVVNRICKHIINGSDDSNLVARYAKATDADLAEAEVEAEIEENANQEIIDVEFEVADEEPEVEEKVAEEPKERKPEEPKQERKQEGKQKTIFEEGPGF